MGKAPSSIFDSGDLDVSGFAPKNVERLNEMSPDLVRIVSEAARFPSREAIPRRPRRIYRTGRTMQFNARATPETVEAFYAIADQQGWMVSEALEHALAALKRELAAPKRELAGAGQGQGR
jgi:hypothetical protein